MINEVQKQRLNGVAYYTCIAMSVLQECRYRDEEHALYRRPAPELHRLGGNAAIVMMTRDEGLDDAVGFSETTGTRDGS